MREPTGEDVYLGQGDGAPRQWLDNQVWPFYTGEGLHLRPVQVGKKAATLGSCSSFLKFLERTEIQLRLASLTL